MQIITQNRFRPKVSILARLLLKRLPPIHPALAGSKQRIDAGMEQAIAAKEDRLRRLWTARLAHQMNQLPPFDDVFGKCCGQFALPTCRGRVADSTKQQYLLCSESCRLIPGVPAYRRRARGRCPAPRAESRPFGIDP